VNLLITLMKGLIVKQNDEFNGIVSEVHSLADRIEKLLLNEQSEEIARLYIILTSLSHTLSEDRNQYDLSKVSVVLGEDLTNYASKIKQHFEKTLSLSNQVLSL